jgi:hypothetical protein
VGIDTYRDGRSGWYFAVNPAGSIADALLFNDTERDDSWDGIWERTARLTPDGWSVEMRIPFSQVRFDEGHEQRWGINFGRKIQRKGEEDHFQLMSRERDGFVSRFAELTGLYDLVPPAHVELVPYVVGGGRFLQHEEGDPFVTGRDPFGSIGADLRMGIGSSLTLNATANPDFGQVEVDPAVLNLSAHENFFQEKRPFFVEGTGIFSFGAAGGSFDYGDNGGGGFGWLNPTFFYSRRIGRSPQGYPIHRGFADIPDKTTILGAAKLTGKVDDGWTIGVLSAATEREYAQIDSAGTRFEEEVEPFTLYNVLRSTHEIEGGRHGIGLLATMVRRDLDNPTLTSHLASTALVGGIDGWTWLDDDREWILFAWGGASHVRGSDERITALQRAPQRYFQEPDADHVEVDTTATSLSGWSGRAQLKKRSGNFRMSAALGAISPGFDVNDIGFGGRADYLNGHINVEYNWFEPDGFFRYKGAAAHAYQSYDFGPTILNAAYGGGFVGQLENFWGFNANIDYTPLTWDTRSTRGGPMIDGPAGWFGNASVYSDTRKEAFVSLFLGGSTSDPDLWGFYSGTEITWRPVEQLRVRLGAEWNREFGRTHYIGTYADSLATQTYGARYVFSDLIQSRLSGEVRLDWAFTPELSVQLYMQPFLAVGQASNFKELVRPRSYEFASYGVTGGTLEQRDDGYVGDIDGDGPARPVTFFDPSFNFKSLRGTAVLRWEFLPGSTAYLVWTHDRANFDNPGTLQLGRDLGDLFGADDDNILMVKVAYWIGT